MPQLNTSIHFWIGLFIFICSAIATGTIHLTGAVPAEWVGPVTAWAGIFNVIGTGYLTAALGLTTAPKQ